MRHCWAHTKNADMGPVIMSWLHPLDGWEARWVT